MVQVATTGNAVEGLELLMPPRDVAAKAALLQKQYFPHVKAAGEEFPALLTSETFTEECALALVPAPKSKTKASAAWTELRTRRFDGLVRRLGIPHPIPYSVLVLHIGNHWSSIEPLLQSLNSQIKPAFHTDGRLVQMDYETSHDSLSRDTRLAQGQRFMVKADISNCFPSVYSHAIDWATRGKNLAKRMGGNDGSWQADLDKFVRNCHDRETKGVMIGPAVSNLLAELVLQRVDEELVRRGHNFLRYVDDYTSYCTDRSVAETFVVDLQHALAEYRLDLNTRKTRIVDLRNGAGEPWIAEVQSHLPAAWTPLATARFLRQAELLAAKYPFHSVLKFAVKATIGQRRAMEQKPSLLVTDELVRLCAFHPHLAPFLASELAAMGGELRDPDAARIGVVLTRLMHEAARRAETDVVLWHLHILRRVLNEPVRKADWQPLIEMNDDLVLLAVAAWCPRARPAAVRQVRNLDYACEADFDQHWLVRYEMHRVGLLSDSDLDSSERSWMAVLVKAGVIYSQLT
ncbi:RNA-directed DNA polymerase [Nocardia caishijiensis]|uniref:RNA-directed DNA polymerase n=1 Tax=Nocardia caishijiensis TaxID=184756 RepID=UPI000829BFBD|nr:RNA-directed DNA polymerase [Nocardia caishijiensis]